jgi:hypothetical protein
MGGYNTFIDGFPFPSILALFAKGMTEVHNRGERDPFSFVRNCLVLFHIKAHTIF